MQYTVLFMRKQNKYKIRNKNEPRYMRMLYKFRILLYCMKMEDCYIIKLNENNLQQGGRENNDSSSEGNSIY